MARLPSDADLGNLPNANSGRQVATFDTTAVGRGMQGLGQGLQSAGASVNNVVERERAADSQLGLARADAAFKVDEIKRRNSLRDDDPDYEAWGESYRKGSRESLAKAEALLPNDPNLRERWRLRNQDEIAKGEAYVDQRMQVRRNDNLVATATSELETARRAALEASDEPSRIKLIDAGKGIIEGLRGKGILSDTQAQKLTKNWTEDYARGSLQLLSPEERIDALRGSVKNTAGFVDRIIGAESSGDPNAKNERSSASGLGQFIDSTWISFMRARHPDILEAEGPRGALRLKNDPRLGREATGWYAEENSKALKSAGLDTSYGNVYLAHFLGPAGATAVLKADKDLPASAVIDDAAINANPFLKGKSVGQVVAWAERKMGGKGSRADIASILSPEERAQGIEKAQHEQVQLARVETAQAARAASERAEQWERVLIDASAGKSPLPARMEIEAENGISTAQKNTLLRQYDTAAKEVGETTMAVRRYVNGELNGDPFNSKVQGDIDKAYKVAVPEPQALLSSDDAGARSRAMTLDVARTTGYVPRRATEMIRGGLSSDDPARVTTALELARQISIAKPGALDVGEGAQSVDKAAVSYRHYVDDLGFTQQEAVRRIMEQRAPDFQTKLRAKVKGEDVDKMVKGLSITDLKGAFNDGVPYFGRPDLTDDAKQRRVMLSEYGEIFRERFYETGDKDEAKKLAQAQLKRIYGISAINGEKVVRRYAPEIHPAYAGIENVSDRMAEQALDDIEKKVGYRPSRETLRLMPVKAATDAFRTRETLPEYTLSWRDKSDRLQHSQREFFFDPAALRAKQTAEREQGFKEAATAASSNPQQERNQTVKRQLRDEARGRIEQTRREVEGNVGGPALDPDL